MIASHIFVNTSTHWDLQCKFRADFIEARRKCNEVLKHGAIVCKHYTYSIVTQKHITIILEELAICNNNHRKLSAGCGIAKYFSLILFDSSTVCCKLCKSPSQSLSESSALQECKKQSKYAEVEPSLLLIKRSQKSLTKKIVFNFSQRLSWWSAVVQHWSSMKYRHNATSNIYVYITNTSKITLTGAVVRWSERPLAAGRPEFSFLIKSYRPLKQRYPQLSCLALGKRGIDGGKKRKTRLLCPWAWYLMAFLHLYGADRWWGPAFINDHHITSRGKQQSTSNQSCRLVPRLIT